MKNNKAAFRHELKYRIDKATKDILVSEISCFMERDRYVKNNIYTVRSLYFDDYCNSSYEEKLMGIANRKKFRIRIYNYSDNCIKLECKNKQDKYIYKETATITKENLEQILKSDFEFLLSRDEEVCKSFYYFCTSRLLRPRLVVDYEREPFVFLDSDTRITFDTNIREAEFTGDLFESNLCSWHVMPPDELIMEVKYTQFLPEYISDILAGHRADYTAASKYVMCCENKIQRIEMLI